MADRGLFWGNRGCLHDKDGNLVRYSTGRAWTICLLDFKGRRRQLWAPGRLTELFFLDEATGLAAGHRPCGECRAGNYRAFKAAWADANPDAEPSAPAIDVHLHADRLARPAVRRTYPARLGDLPDGTDLDGHPWLVNDHLNDAEEALGSHDRQTAQWERDFRSTTDHLRDLLNERPWPEAG
ncbi:MAG: hypothetical protein ACRD0J_10180 [Acidimicrobiales bacterium]